MDDDLFDVFEEQPLMSSAGPAAASAQSSSSPAGATPEAAAATEKRTRDEDATADAGAESAREAVEEEAGGIDPAAAPLEEGLAVDKGAVDEGHSTAMDVTLPPKEKMAKTYPFELDPFQRRAIGCLERNESVLVSAHTSAGKTVVAEYAIALALRNKQRVIYTSPIKALSNQKYRELYEEFGDVGLMTGDTTIAPSASCLVMTTEILRSMLYRGSEVVREVKWVIYDEVHYMRDRERGVVWEESIILLPDSVRYVFLSATIPNAREFAAWVGSLHRHTCHVVYTQYRPTPLQHFMFPAGAEGVFLIVDERGKFRDDNFSKAMACLEDGVAGEDAAQDAGAVGAGASGGSGKRKRKGKKGMQRGKGPSDLYRVVKMVMERGYDPVIVFSFSKRETERNAMQISKLDLTSAEEKAMIDQIFKAALSSLAEDDRQLPQIVGILPLLRKGIGIHHGGLLPILKEVIEILFSESYIKVLFATETFAMGVNMPAKTVIFTSGEKFDGEKTRLILAGEYTQMAGRAGRRGLDDRGIVMWMVQERMERDTVRGIMCGSANPLDSAFHLGYNMLLNVMRIEDGAVDPETIMAKSFHQFQAQRSVPALKHEIARLLARAASLVVEDEEDARAFLSLVEDRARARKALRDIITQPAHAVRFLQPGRVVRVVDGDTDWGYGVLVSFRPRAGSAAARASAAAEAHRGNRSGSRGKGRGRGRGGGKSGRNRSQTSARSAETEAATEIRTGPASDVIVDVLLRCTTSSPPVSSDLDQQDGDETSAASSSSASTATAPAVSAAARATIKTAFAGYTDPATAPTFAPGAPRPLQFGGAGAVVEARVLPVVLTSLDELTQLCLHLPKDLRTAHARMEASRRLQEVQARMAQKGRRLPLLNPEEDMGIEGSEALEEALKAHTEAESAIRAHSLGVLDPGAGGIATLLRRAAADAAGSAAPSKSSSSSSSASSSSSSSSSASASSASSASRAATRLSTMQQKLGLERRAAWLQKQVDKTKSLVMRGTLKRMKRVLRRLGHTDATAVVQLKGRVACEVNTADELLCTELMFEGAFNELTPAQVAATMSCLVASDRSKDDEDPAKGLPAELRAPLKMLQEAARRVGRVSEEAGIEIEIDDYVKSMSPSLMAVIYSWANGARFSEIVGMTKEFEGSIIRVIRRLEELLRQLADAARAVGDEALDAKFRAASASMRRDIVFAASLYT